MNDADAENSLPGAIHVYLEKIKDAPISQSISDPLQNIGIKTA